FQNLVNDLALDAVSLEIAFRSARRDQLETHRLQILQRGYDSGLVGFLDGHEHRAGAWKGQPRTELAFPERHREVAVDAHDLAGRAHFGTEDRIDAGEPREREHRFLDRDVIELRR